jgi:hypothetical protein
MPMRADDRGEVHVVDRWDGGLSWMAHPEETMRRTSHALVVDEAVWLVDPLDGEDLDGVVADLGSVAGVVVLSTYHLRDADAIAERYDVAVHLPAAFDGVADRVDAPVERFDDELAGTGFRAVDLDGRFWTEVALYHPGRGTLVAADVLTTREEHSPEDGRLVVTPYLQLWPPRGPLSGLDVDRVLVGHGTGVFEDADEALVAALSVSRWDALRTVVANLPSLLRAAYVATR